jgi:hypothetical protein
MLIPTKYADDINRLKYGHHGWHGFRHRLALAIMPRCIRDLTIVGLMVATHPDEVMNALFEKSLTEYADQAAANEGEEARR